MAANPAAKGRANWDIGTESRPISLIASASPTSPRASGRTAAAKLTSPTSATAMSTSVRISSLVRYFHRMNGGRVDAMIRPWSPVAQSEANAGIQKERSPLSLE